MIDDLYDHLRSLEEYRHLSETDFQVEPLQTLDHSEVYRIHLTSPPASLIVKRSGGADTAGLAERERRFYQHLAPRLPAGLVPACRLVVPSSGLILEDLSASHAVVRDRNPSFAEYRGLVEALAILHGCTEGDAELRSQWMAVARELPAATLAQRLSFFQHRLPGFLDQVRDRLDSDDLRFLLQLRNLDARIHPDSLAGTSLVHGDAHVGNVLFAADDRACLIDWGMPMLAVGEVDLAHALALNLPRELRRQWERDLIQTYLEQRSVDHNEAFEVRYRFGVLYSFVSPVAWWSAGVAESHWWPALMNLLDAARERELLS